jgi:hypothetical protein
MINKIRPFGCEMILKKYFEVTSKYGELSLVAVCDNDDITLDKAIKKTSTTRYGDFNLFIQNLK